MKAAPLLVVTGTGTGIGKTHLTGALLLAWAHALREASLPEPKVLGLKPVETGVSASEGAELEPGSDGFSLEQLSTFHVKHIRAPYLLARAVSPHLAARDEGVTIDPQVIRAYVDAARALADAVAVELAGGLFSPLGPGVSNADVAHLLAPDAVLLVAPDRLGVLHEVAATTRAATAAGVPITGIVLVAPEKADASTGTNAAELGVVTEVPVLAAVPRASREALARRPDLLAIVRALLRTPALRPLP